MGFISSGTTMFDNGALVASAGDMVLLSTATASSSASLSFDSTYINSDYLIYKFELINIHPASNGYLTFNLSTDNGSNYNVAKTTTYFNAYHNESGADSGLFYSSGQDLANGTGDQQLASLKSDNDNNCGGNLTLFNPSSTTFVKHFTCDISNNNNPYSEHYFIAGYANTSSAVNSIIFRQGSNIDGVIKLYGIKGS